LDQQDSLLKYLFAQDNNHRTQSEIVFAITPHIVRSQEVTEDNLASIEVGTGSSIELRRKPPVPPAATAQAVPPPSASGPSRPATAPTSAQRCPQGSKLSLNSDASNLVSVSRKSRQSACLAVCPHAESVVLGVLGTKTLASRPHLC